MECKMLGHLCPNKYCVVSACALTNCNPHPARCASERQSAKHMYDSRGDHSSYRIDSQRKPIVGKCWWDSVVVIFPFFKVIPIMHTEQRVGRGDSGRSGDSTIDLSTFQKWSEMGGVQRYFYTTPGVLLLYNTIHKFQSFVPDPTRLIHIAPTCNIS